MQCTYAIPAKPRIMLTGTKLRTSLTPMMWYGVKCKELDAFMIQHMRKVSSIHNMTNSTYTHNIQQHVHISYAQIKCILFSRFLHSRFLQLSLLWYSQFNLSRSLASATDARGAEKKTMDSCEVLKKDMTHCYCCFATLLFSQSDDANN
jgi:hypothetical protein